MPKRSLPSCGAALLLLAGALADPAPGQVALSDGPASQPAPKWVVVPQSRAFSMAPDALGVHIESVRAHVAILDRTARTTVQVALRNSSSRQDDAVILLPVPRGAAVTAFTFQGESAEPDTQVLTADEARRVYDSIVAKVMDPALLEFAGYNVVRSSVFPVPAQGTQQIRLTYEHLLPADGNRIDYTLPRSEALDRRRPWDISVDLASTRPVSTVYSPSHALAAKRTGPGAFEISLTDDARHEPGSFRLSWLMEGDGVAASLMAYPDPQVGAGGAGGYFLLMAGLPADAAVATRTVKREVTLVLDRSGSMAGGKLEQVRAAATQVIEGLADGEAFNILDYSTAVSAFAPKPVIRSADTARAARDYLAAMRPGGGTNIHDALFEAMRQEPASDEHLSIVLFLTDGLPTIGRTGEADIGRMVDAANTRSRRVFTFGVGHDVNAPLLDRLADTTRGVATYIMPDQDVEVAVAGVFNRLHGPVFANAKLETLDPDGVVGTRLVAETMPRRLPDLFDGDQLILLGEYRTADPVTFRLTGEYLGEERSFEFTFDLDDATTRNAFVPRLWASRRIAELIDEIRQAGAAVTPGTVGVPIAPANPRRELVDEIVRLSTRFGILTEYTAFFAREGTDLSDFEELAAGCGRELSVKAIGTRWGTAAVNQAMNNNAQKLQSALNHDNVFINDRLERQVVDNVQQMCDLAFFRRDNRWIDSRLLAFETLPEPQEIVILGSDTHRELLERLATRGRGAVLSLVGEILLLVDGRTVLVKDGC